MKKLSILPVISIVFISAVNAQPKKSDREKDNLIGQVKWVEESYYKAKEKFGDVVPDVKTYVATTEYNKDGMMKTFEFYDVDDKETTNRTFKYNDKNLVVEQKEVEDGEVTIGKVIYDSKNRVVEVNAYDKKDNLKQKTKNKYDTAGRILQSDVYDSDGSLRLSEIYKYDFWFGSGMWKRRVNKKVKIEENWVYELSADDVNPPRMKRFDGEAEFFEMNLDFGGSSTKMSEIKPKDSKKEVRISTYTYNAQGLVKSEERETSRNHVVSSTLKTVYEYDKYGNKTLEKDSDKYFTTYTYEYDEKGNWIKQIETHNTYGSVYHYYSERKIKYY